MLSPGRVKSPSKADQKESLINPIVIKHSFGCNVLPLDPIQTFPIHASGIAVEKVYNNRIMYAVGKTLCATDEASGSNEYIVGKLKCNNKINHFIISSNQRYVSVCETMERSRPTLNKTTENATTSDTNHQTCVSVYNISTMARFKSLFYETESDFICSTFSNDYKYLICLTGAPNRQIVLFNFEKEKLYRVINLEDIAANCLRVCPSEASLLLTTSGNNCLKSWAMQPDNNSFKPQSILVPARESVKFLDHLWLPSSTATEYRMIALTDLADSKEIESGSQILSPNSPFNTNQNKRQYLYIFEGTETITAAGIPTSSFDLHQTINLRGTNLNQQNSISSPMYSSSNSNLDSNPKIEAIGGTEKGFVLVGENGYISIYEKTIEKKDSFMEVRRLSLGDVTLKGVSIIVEDEQLCVVTSSNRIVKVSLITQLQSNSNDNMQEPKRLKSIRDLKERSQFRLDDNDDLYSKQELLKPMARDVVFGGCHTYGIRAADAAKEKPFLITVSNDHTARIWDYEQMKCELVHSFKNDDPIGVSFHPSGLQVLVAFRDKVSLYSVLIDQLFLIKEVVVKKCQEVKFSNLGHLWACVSHTTIHIFDTVTFQNLAVLTGHILPVKRLIWVSYDYSYLLCEFLLFLIV